MLSPDGDSFFFLPFPPILCALWGESKSLECLFQQSQENIPTNTTTLTSGKNVAKYHTMFDIITYVFAYFLIGEIKIFDRWEVT